VKRSLGLVAAVVLAGTPIAGPCGRGLPTIEVRSAAESGPGSLRAAIEAANSARRPVRIVSRLAENSVVRIHHQLPTLSAAGTVFDANRLTLVGGGCMRPDGKKGCDGLVLGGSNLLVRRLHARGFTFDGIAVRGRAAKKVVIEECQSRANLDDGVGVSAGASEVVVRRCLLEDNGFRTKGKGVLVFDEASALLEDNTIRGNRDGVTVSRRAQATLLDNRIIGNYDKGLGVAGARAEGSGNRIESNGRGMAGRPPPPNADGLRVTLGSRVELHDTVIRGNGDAGVVVLDDSRVALRGGSVSENRRRGVVARDAALVDLHSVELARNGGRDTEIEGEARIRRVF